MPSGGPDCKQLEIKGFRKNSGSLKPLDSLGLRRRQVSFSQTTFIWSSRLPGCDPSLGPIQPRKTAGRRNPAVRIRYSIGVYDGASAGIGEKRDQTAFGDILHHQQLGSPLDSHAAKDAGCARAEATSTSSRPGRWGRPRAAAYRPVKMLQLQPALLPLNLFGIIRVDEKALETWKRLA